MKLAYRKDSQLDNFITSKDKEEINLVDKKPRFYNLINK